MPTEESSARARNSRKSPLRVREMPSRGARKGIFYGWWIVLIGLLVNAVPAGLYFIGFAVLFLPITRDLGMSRAAASLPFSLTRAIAAVQSPFIGIIIDRFGPGRVLFFCSLFAGLGFILLSRADSYLTYFLVVMFVLSPPIMGGFDSTSITATCRWFIRKRGMALAITVLGFSIGGAALPPLLAISSDAFGWRTTLLVSGLALWAIFLPLSTRMYSSPEARGLLPDGDIPEDETESDASQSRPQAPGFLVQDGMTPKEAFKTPTYWILALSLAMRGMVFTAISIHVVAMMTWKGIDEGTAGLLISFMSMAWLPISLFMGWLGDRFEKKMVARAGAIIAGFGMFTLAYLDNVTPWHMILIFVMWAFSEGGLPLGWAMLADQFGRRSFGVLRGGMMATFGVLGLGTPLYAGWVYDSTQSYQWVIIPAGALLVTAGLLGWAMPRLATATSQSQAS